MFSRLLAAINPGDLLVVTKLDRFCRSTKAGLSHIEEITGKGARIHILNMGLIEDTPMGKLIVTNLLAFAEFERAMIVERTQAGKAITKTKNGYREGRPAKYSEYQLANAVSLLESNSYKQVEDMTGISKSTLIRARRALVKTEAELL